MKNKPPILVGVIMESKSDWANTMLYCSETLKQFGVKHDVKVISAHRTPKRLHKFLKNAKKNKMETIEKDIMFNEFCKSKFECRYKNDNQILSTSPNLSNEKFWPPPSSSYSKKRYELMTYLMFKLN